MTSPDNQSDILIIDGLTVDYGPRMGLDGMRFKLKQGDIHAVLGPHGSGKSTLINVISGRIPKFNGTVLFDNHILKKLSPKKAIKLGIRAIYHELYLYPKWSAFENIFFDHRIKKHFIVNDKSAMRAKALDIFNALSVNIDLDTPIMYYNVSQQQMIQIAKNICFPAKLLLIDELSVKLDPEQLERFQYLLSILRQRGTSILYATSNMDEIFNFASKVTVLKNGQVVETANIAEIDKIQLVKLTYSFMTSRKELEKSNFELFYLKNFYEGVFNNIPLPFMVTDTKGNIIFINTRLNNLLKINREEYLDHFFNDLFKFPEDTLREIQHKIYNGEDLCFSNYQPEHFPEQSYCKLYMVPSFDEDESFIGIRRIFSYDDDVNDREDQEDKKNKCDGISSMDKITGWIAHEIKNPLSIILNYLKLIKTENSIEQIKNNTENVEKEVRRIKHIIEKLINMAALQKETSKKIKLDSLFNDVINLMKPTIDQNRVKLELNYQKDIFVSVDPDLLKQVVVNMVLNAVESMPYGGLLRISSNLQNIEQKAFIMIEFKDNGVGIKKKDIRNIFNPFYTTKNNREMGGLGLSICRDIVSQYEGHITVDSTPQLGSTFRIFLPYG